MVEKHHWGYDFTCKRKVDAIRAAFNAAGPWQWEKGDSDIYGDYLKCQPKENANIRVYERSQFRTWRPWDRGGFYAELEGDAEAWPDIDHQFLCLLEGIKAKNITKT